MTLALKTEIISAAQDSRFIRDPFFEGDVINRYQNGRPEYYSGGFSVVFVIYKDAEKWAFKVWSEEIDNNRHRYSQISQYLENVNLPYFSSFEYVSGGLLVNGDLLDTLRMKWLEGRPLVHYLATHIYDAEILRALAAEFLEMTKNLHQHSISHGDLQHENIYVADDGKIKLLDYDSICVPSLIGSRDVCLGTIGYQHPSRFSAGYISSEKIDYFSELIIYISILAFSESPILWFKYKVLEADYRLLFTPEDFLRFEDSPIRHDLNLLSEDIQSLVRILDNYLAAHLNLIPVVSHVNG